MRLKFLIVLLFFTFTRPSELLAQQASLHERSVYGQLSEWGADTLDAMLETGVDLMLNGDYLNAYQYLKTCAWLSEQAQEYDLFFLATNNMGNIYYFLNEMDSAMFYFYQALQIAEDHDLLKRKNTILNNIGIMLSRAGKDTEARDALKEALRISVELNDERSVALNSVNLAEHLLALNNYEEADGLIQSSIDYFELGQDEYALSSAYHLKGELHFQKAEFTLAEVNYWKALEYLDTKVHAIDKPTYFGSIAKCKSAMLQYDSAISYYELAKRTAVEIKLYKVATQALDSLSSIYLRQNELEKSIRASQESRSIRDSIIAIEKKDELEKAKMLFDFRMKENQFRLLAKKNEERRNYIIAVLVLMILVVVLLLFLIRLKNRESALKQAKYELEQLRSKEKLDKSRAKNEQLRDRIENINYELVSRSLLIDGKNQILSSISEIVKNIEINAQGEELESISNLKRQLLMEKSSEKNWEDFSIFFERIHADFFAKIHKDHPDLTTNDLRLLAYLLLMLSTKEIANNLGITSESVRKRKQRIREKLDLRKEEDLLVYLRSYS